MVHLNNMKSHRLLLLASFFILAASTLTCAYESSVGQAAFTEGQPPPTSQEALACVHQQLPLTFHDAIVLEPGDGLAQITLFDSIAPSNISTANFFKIAFAKRNPETLDLCPAPSDYFDQDAPISLDGCIRVDLVLGQCQPTMTFQITGTLNLTRYGITHRARTSGQVQGLLHSIVYGQTGTETTRRIDDLGDLDVSFDFKQVRPGGFR